MPMYAVLDNRMVCVVVWVVADSATVRRDTRQRGSAYAVDMYRHE